MEVFRSFDARDVLSVIEGLLPLSVIGRAAKEMLELLQRLALIGGALSRGTES